MAHIPWPKSVTAELSFSRQNFLQPHLEDAEEHNGRLMNMGAGEDTVDGLIRKYFFKGFKYREICLFLERNHECVITTLQPTNSKNWT